MENSLDLWPFIIRPFLLIYTFRQRRQSTLWFHNKYFYLHDMRCIFVHVHYRTVYLTDSCSSIVIPFCPRPHVSVRARDWSIVSNQYMAEERSFGGSFGNFILDYFYYVCCLTCRVQETKMIFFRVYL